MREVGIINKGENVEMVCYNLGLNYTDIRNEEVILEYNVIDIKNGEDDITIVRNYQPCFIRKINNQNNITSINENGYKVLGGDCDSASVVVQKISGVKYYVKPLETIEELSKNFGTSVEDIMLKNNLKTNKLFVGQILYF